MNQKHKELRPSMDVRIINILEEEPLTEIYFSVGIALLKECADKMSDDELLRLFGNLPFPDFIRHSVTTIYNRLNQIDEK